MERSPRHSHRATSHMEVDAPAATAAFELPAPASALKRSSSAPTINLLCAAAATDDDAEVAERFPRRSSSPLLASRPGGSTTLFHGGSSDGGGSGGGSAFRPVELPLKPQHERSLSGGSSCGSSCGNGSLCTTPVKAISRLYQIKKEEQAGCSAAAREVAHEREVQSSLQISHSWEEMHLSEGAEAAAATAAATAAPGPSEDGGCSSLSTTRLRPRSLSDSLHVLTASGCFPAPSSPSPTVGKQCFSPSMQQPVSAALCSVQSATTSPTPSPTRRLFRRSLSPIVSVRPSGLCLKRKLDIESPDSGMCSPKRVALANASGSAHLFMMANATDNRLGTSASHSTYDDGHAGLATASRLSSLADTAASGTDSESDMSSAESGAGSVTESSLDDTAAPRQRQQQHQLPAEESAAVHRVPPVGGCCRPGMTRQTSVP